MGTSATVYPVAGLIENKLAASVLARRKRVQAERRPKDAEACGLTQRDVWIVCALSLCDRSRGGKVVLINLQPTRLEPRVSLSIHGLIDDVFRRLMPRLGLAKSIPSSFILRRFVRVQQRLRGGRNSNELEVRVGGLVGPEEGAGTIALFKDVVVVSCATC